MKNLLDEILKMSVADRIVLVEIIWDSIAIENMKLADEQMKLIKDRWNSFKKNPEKFLKWEQIKESLPPPQMPTA